jgi:hypothetical protein
MLIGADACRTHFQAAAAKPFVPIGNRPTDHIAKRIMMQVQFERNFGCDKDDRL